MIDRPELGYWKKATTRLRRTAWTLILIADLGFVVWGAMAAALPDHLLGPGGKPILAAGYEGFSEGSWSELVSTAPMTAKYIGILFRMYGIYCAGSSSDRLMRESRFTTSLMPLLLPP